MTVQQLIDAFLRFTAEHRRPKTEEHYRARLKRFADEFGDREISTLTAIEVEDHLTRANYSPKGLKYAPDTIRANAVVFGVFQNWLLNRDVIEKPILRKIHKPAGRLRDRIPKRSETAEILKRADRPFYLIYNTLRQTGARPGELCRAQIADWDREKGAIIVRDHKTVGKTGRPREIPVGKKVERLILRSIGKRTTGPIFRTKQKKEWTVRNLSSHFRRLRNAAGLPTDLVLYLSRHEHATALTDKYGIHAAQQALGHSSILTTQRYVKQDLATMRERQDGFET